MLSNGLRISRFWVPGCVDSQATLHPCPSWKLVTHSQTEPTDCSRALNKHVAYCDTCLVLGISVWVTLKHSIPTLTFYFFLASSHLFNQLSMYEVR